MSTASDTTFVGGGAFQVAERMKIQNNRTGKCATPQPSNQPMQAKRGKHTRVEKSNKENA
jgi:hypothetical protein